ncbi:aldehyde dehydrogenase family protein [Phaeobacter sp. HF9A]|uniref:aldehyde dehydrogenase family protein n=1 Tax=Phaeobacter sp. HF9A TaxID=2721561 RepID=UPI001431BDAE|nr:aldehyde dehydrogenase family protein [Phaeobacter sp. HF9A]NIZ11911.1 aldehyde dehydrogenase family protein [Phaeobacter sp. HF9A]
MKTELYIDGAFVAPAGGATLPAVDPATEQVFAQVASGGAEDIDRAVRAARRAFDAGVWSDLPATERAAVLRRIANGIRENLADLAALETRDNGKPLPEAQWDIEDAAFCFDYYADLAEADAAQPLRTNDVGDARFDSRVLREPVGVVAAITPWNFPMLMAVWKVAPALAAGCCVVLKPSELCAMTCHALAGIIDKAGLPAGVFNLVTGFGAEAGAPLSEHALVDKVAFTGSVATGRKVMQAASAGIRTVSLELGGKSPFLVFDDCDIDKAVEWILFGIFWNKGEVCSATSRVLVQRGIYARLIERLKEVTEAIRIGAGDQPGVKLGPIVSKGQYDKILGFLERAKDSGARLVTGGGRAEGFEVGYYIAPTIYADVPLDAEIWREEIFGPVVCLNPFDTEEEALRLANDSPYGLAAAVMSDDLERCDRVAAKLRAGIIWINCSQPTFTQAPWGGYKSSGIGRELGREGFDAFLETKQVTRFDHSQTWGWYLDEEEAGQ